MDFALMWESVPKLLGGMVLTLELTLLSLVLGFVAFGRRRADAPVVLPPDLGTWPTATPSSSVAPRSWFRFS